MAGLTLHYRVDASYLHAMLVCTRAGTVGNWLAVGFTSAAGTMVPATAVIGSFSAGVALYDLNSRSTLGVTRMRDSWQTLRTPSFETQGSTTMLSFHKDLLENLLHGSPISPDERATDLIFAVGQQQDLSQHAYTDRASATVWLGLTTEPLPPELPPPPPPSPLARAPAPSLLPPPPPQAHASPLSPELPPGTTEVATSSLSTDGLPAAAVGGGVAAFVLLLAGGGLLWYLRARRRKAKADAPLPPPPEPLHKTRPSALKARITYSNFNELSATVDAVDQHAVQLELSADGDETQTAGPATDVKLVHADL